MESEIKKGRKWLIFIIAAFLSLELHAFQFDMIRFLLTIVLCVFLSLGFNWARWLAGILASLACLMSPVFLYSYSLGYSPGLLYFFTKAIGYGSMAYLLFFSKSVRTYFRVGRAVLFPSRLQRRKRAS